VADRDDVVRIARSLPEVVVEEDGDRYALSVPRGGKHKGIAWTWMERVEPGRPRVPNPAVLAVRVENGSEKEMLLAARPPGRWSVSSTDAGTPSGVARIARPVTGESDSPLARTQPDALHQ